LFNTLGCALPRSRDRKLPLEPACQPQISGRPEEALDLPKLHIKILSTSSLYLFHRCHFWFRWVFDWLRRAWSGIGGSIPGPSWPDGYGCGPVNHWTQDIETFFFDPMLKVQKFRPSGTTIHSPSRDRCIIKKSCYIRRSSKFFLRKQKESTILLEETIIGSEN